MDGSTPGLDARGRSLVPIDFDSALPEIAYVSDLARWLRTTEKAVRDRVRRDQLPRPGKVGKRLRGVAPCCLIGRENAAGRLGHPA